MKYARQRELFIELLYFGKEQAKIRATAQSEKMKNPNYHNIQDEKPTKMLQSFLKTEGGPVTEQKPLKAIQNDRIAPPKILYKCQVYKKGTGILASEKTMWLFLGITHFIFTGYIFNKPLYIKFSISDPEGKNIQYYFPTEQEHTGLVKGGDAASIFYIWPSLKF